MILNNNKAFTLIEVMITIVVLFVGVLAMTSMQVRAIKGNSSALSRTSANSIALTFLEELKRLPFNDSNLAVVGTNLNAGSSVGGAAPNPAAADHQYVPASLPGLAAMFTVNGNNIVDSSGNQFQIFWNVQNTTIQVGTNTYTPFCTIRIFMYWGTSLGRNSLSITTNKYNNT